MKNTLLGRGILLPTGEISKDKINLVAGAITQPFAEMVWATTGGDWEPSLRNLIIFPALPFYWIDGYSTFFTLNMDSKTIKFVWKGLFRFQKLTPARPYSFTSPYLARRLRASSNQTSCCLPSLS